MSKFGYRSTAEEVSAGHNLEGKVVIVTGASSGLGQECARVFALRGAHVFMAVRDLQKAQPIADDIRKSTNNSHVEVMRLDLGSWASVREFAKEFLAKNLPINILLLNAGIMAVPFARVEGYESQFATNHLSHFLLSLLLLPALKAGKPSRLVAVSSIAHRRSGVRFDDINFEKEPYEKWVAYGQSKCANVLFVMEFQKHYSSHGISAFAVHPGGIATGLQSSLTKEEMIALGWFDAEGKPNPLFKTIEQGASTSMWASLSADLEGKGGIYLENCEEGKSPDPAVPYAGWWDNARDPEAAAKLWTLSEKAVNETSPH